MMQTQLNPRTGFYYFPDTLHYREEDIHKWIPELQALKAGWLTLLSPIDRAIPETFIHAIIDAEIIPVIHFPLPISGEWNLDDLRIIFEAYSHWGIKYIVLFDRPNLHRNWTAQNWAQENLVDRFLDIFIPIAHLSLQSGLLPSFPALEPGGDYWDTAFLYAALLGLNRRGETNILDHLILSAYAWTGNRTPNWGAGGPERWPEAKPYKTPQKSEDHLGFRIFDWYFAISQAGLGKLLPIIILAGGSRIGDRQDPRSQAVDLEAHTYQNITVARIMSGQFQGYDPVPPEVLTCNFWVLSAEKDDPEEKNAWVKADNTELPIVSVYKEWAAGMSTENQSQGKAKFSPSIPGFHPISHYLLLPGIKPGATNHQLDFIRPFVNKYQPTIGFSPVEASHAKKVTIISSGEKIPESIIDGLLAAGCTVEQISEDGMNVATESTSKSKQ